VYFTSEISKFYIKNKSEFVNEAPERKSSGYITHADYMQGTDISEEWP
jgi:hypothetical protein